MRMMARVWLGHIESRFDAAFTPDGNPLYHLGALGWFFYWIVAASGIYLYIFFDTGVERAYLSVETITHVQWYAGGVMRSLHRYASDGLVLVMMLHLLREYVLGRMYGPRWFTWVVGVPILWLVFAAGITGYWVVWDKLAQYVALATSQWLDSLPLFGEPIARNFLHVSTLSSRFFTLMVFIHIAVPLFLLLVMWLHVHRLSVPRLNPPKSLAIGTLSALLVLSFLRPAVSQGPANLSLVPAEVKLDWFYLWLYPLLDRVPGLAAWLGLMAGSLVLAALAWLPPKRTVAAVVNLDNCNGCGRCAADCPHEAILMVPRTDGRTYAEEAKVNGPCCVACGICVGACPTATPFRRREILVSGIELPEQPIAGLRQQALALSEALEGTSRLLVFGCQRGVDLEPIASPSVAGIVLPCIGMLPPSFLDLLITRGHVEGVLLTGCRAGDCYERLGVKHTEQRMARARDPRLRARVPRERIRTLWTGIDRPLALAEAVAEFQSALSRLSHDQAPMVHRRLEASTGAD